MRTDSPVDRFTAADLEHVPACPICRAAQSARFADGLHDVTPSATPGSWSVRRCLRCASVFLSPRPTVTSIGRAYESPNYFTHAEPEPAPARGRLGQLRVRLRNGYLNGRHGYRAAPAYRLGALLLHAIPPLAIRSDFWIRHLSHPGGTPRLLDVGCGDGRHVAHLRGLGWDVDGIDPDPQAVAVARRAGVNARVGTLVGLSRELRPDYDAITLSHSIEHLHDPRETLSEARRLLKPGGSLWLATPNAGSIGLWVFGPHWRGLEPPRHLVVASAKALRALLEEIGFEHISSPARPPGAAWYFASSRAVARRSQARRGRLPRSLVRAAAVMADAIGLVRPDLREESVLIARRPPAG